MNILWAKVQEKVKSNSPIEIDWVMIALTGKQA
jgi:hypothetical protein